MTLSSPPSIAEICQLAPVIPVLVVDDLAQAATLGETLIAGGFPVLEVTLRTDCALNAIKAMAGLQGGVVGAGTLLNPMDVQKAKAAGAHFGVSPGATDELIAACQAAALPLLPGAATASEVMTLLAKGFHTQKFFPAEAAGGATLLKSLASPLPQVKFCPTGGITLETAADYLALDNVLCVGGSWLAPKDAVQAGDFAKMRDILRRTQDQLG